MKVCIPISESKGLDSAVSEHFGSAPCFLIYDMEADRFDVIDNGCKEHMKGKCHPTQALMTLSVDAVACKGMGLRALQQLAASGIRALKADATSVAGVIEEYRSGSLAEMDPVSACQDHSCHTE